MKISLITLLIVLTGCTTHPQRPEPMPVPVLMADQDYDATTWHVINELVNSRYTWTVKDRDPFDY